jgi:hypothetical protein
MKNDGGPAFPFVAYTATKKDTGEIEISGLRSEGMSLRDWFAGQALERLASSGGMFASPCKAARKAYAYADAMLKERDR